MMSAKIHSLLVIWDKQLSPFGTIFSVNNSTK